MGGQLKNVRLILVLLLGSSLFIASAGAASKPLDESQQLFFNQFRYAIQAHDAQQLIRLTHPDSLACIPDEDREFYYSRILDGLANVLGRRQIIQGLRAVNFTPGDIEISKDLPSGENVNWPVVPESQIIFDYEWQGREAVASLYLARDNGDWKWVHICTK